jgi:isopentenyl diphosphate isomerase/L-lactate dehydrogenase-like FMN-dependent dehydrogenase
VSPEGNVRWENDAPKAIELGAKAREIAVKALEALDKAGSVTEQHLSLFDKFGVGLD